MIRVLVFAPNQHPVAKEITGSLQSMQELVDGFVQMVPIGQGLDLVCNEEGKLNGANPNRFVPVLEDMIFGTFFITKCNKDGDLVSLTGQDIMNASILVA